MHTYPETKPRTETSYFKFSSHRLQNPISAISYKKKSSYNLAQARTIASLSPFPLSFLSPPPFPRRRIPWSPRRSKKQYATPCLPPITDSTFIADVIATPVVYSAQTLTGALIGTCFFSLVAGFASGFWFSQRLRGAPYPEPSEQRQQLNRLTESSESPGFNNKSINLVLNVPPKNPNGKNANSSAENKPVQKVKKTYIWYRRRHRAVWGLPQDPTGSGSSSSSSSSSDLAESDDRNDDDDDDDEPNNVDDVEDNRVPSAGRAVDQLAGHEEDAYESVASEGRSLEFLAAPREAATYDSRSMVVDYGRRGYVDHQFPSGGEYTETALMEPSVNGLQDYSSSSANSLDDLCRGHRHRALDEFNRGDESRGDHYMVPTRDPRELNERILSLFNPQFLPNFNDMIMYVANQYDARRSPPPRSRSMADGEDRLFRRSSCRKKRVGASSMFFRRGLTYEAARKWHLLSPFGFKRRIQCWVGIEWWNERGTIGGTVADEEGGRPTGQTWGGGGNWSAGRLVFLWRMVF